MSHVVLVASGMVLALLLQAFFWPGRGLAWGRGTQGIAGARAESSGPAPAWGRLEYTPIALDRPEEYFTNEFKGSVNTAWLFRNHTEQQLDALFTSLDLSAQTLSQLKNRSNWTILPRAIRVSPPAPAVVEMTPESRKRLYEILAQNPQNTQFTPFRFRAQGFDDWFADCGLSKEKIQLIHRLTYTNEEGLCFSDAPAFSQLSTPAETKALIKCLWRVSTFVLKIRVDQATDVDALMKYWGAFGAEKAYRPLIESMTRVQGGSTINLSYFLPPFARLRLYTYPDPRDTNLLHEDCFWSAMNFFNTSPDAGFFNPDYIQKVLSEEYFKPQDDSKQFGDVLLLLGKNNKALHMCVYLADDMVFTKNGANTQQPWVLMRMSEMLGEYENEKPFQLVSYRRKTPPSLGFVPQYSSGKSTL